MTLNFEFENQEIKTQINYLLQQKPLFTLLINSFNLFTINIFRSKNHIEICSKYSEKKIINTPFDFHQFSKEIEKIANCFYLDFNNANYYPYLNKIIYNEKILLLNDIHNKILINLIYFDKEGLNKLDLYKFLWEKDKNISINKLDTHLTNLKNLINNNLAINLKFKSTNNLIFLN